MFLLKFLELDKTQWTYSKSKGLQNKMSHVYIYITLSDQLYYLVYGIAYNYKYIKS